MYYWNIKILNFLKYLSLSLHVENPESFIVSKLRQNVLFYFSSVKNVYSTQTKIQKK